MTDVARANAVEVGLRLLAGLIFVIGTGFLVLRYGITTSMRGFLPGTIRFFSFFTIFSGLLVAVTTGFAAFAPHSPIGRAVTRPAWSGGVALYILLTGIVYFILLRPLESPQGLDAAANIGLHYVLPILYPLYWLLAVPKGELKLVDVAWWLVFPIGYAIVSLIRGPIVAWYPYPFIDASILPLWRLVVNIVAVSAGFILFGLVLLVIDRLLGGGRTGSTTRG